LIENIGDGIYGIVLVRHPAPLVRVLVHKLLYDTSLFPVGSAYSSIPHVNSVVSSRCHGLEGFFSELRVAKALVVDDRLLVDFYAGGIPLVLASLFSLLASCLEKAVAEFIRGSAVIVVDQCAVLFGSIAAHSFVSFLAGLFSEYIGSARHPKLFDASTFICLVEPPAKPTEARANKQDVENGEPLDSLLPEVEVLVLDLLLVDEGSESELLFLGLVLVLVDGELLLALDRDVWLLGIGESLVLGELF